MGVYLKTEKECRCNAKNCDKLISVKKGTSFDDSEIKWKECNVTIMNCWRKILLFGDSLFYRKWSTE